MILIKSDDCNKHRAISTLMESTKKLKKGRSRQKAYLVTFNPKLKKPNAIGLEELHVGLGIRFGTHTSKSIDNNELYKKERKKNK